ncbi:hypothetical protein [Amycolatopsis sp. NPDC051371]
MGSSARIGDRPPRVPVPAPENLGFEDFSAVGRAAHRRLISMLDQGS